MQVAISGIGAWGYEAISLSERLSNTNMRCARRSREDGDVLYRLVLEYADAGGALVDAGAALSSPNELPLILPGTPATPTAPSPSPTTR